MEVKLEIHREERYSPLYLRITVAMPTGETAYSEISLRELGNAIANECADEED